MNGQNPAKLSVPEPVVELDLVPENVALRPICPLGTVLTMEPVVPAFGVFGSLTTPVPLIAPVSVPIPVQVLVITPPVLLPSWSTPPLSCVPVTGIATPDVSVSVKPK